MTMRVAFLANAFHTQKTKSADFFIELLRRNFEEVTVVPHKDAWAELPMTKWDLLIVWQKRYSPEELESFGAERVVLVPMYDDTPLEESYWRKYRNFKIFCFSSTLERLLVSYGLCAWGVRYFPETPRRTAVFGPKNGLRGFFWPRVPAIDWTLIRRLIGESEFAGVNIHWTPEIHADRAAPPADFELANGKISISTWNGDRGQYLDRLLQSNVFFAPRTAEGIGMSFVEAMTLGMCVVAANAPTMNEYLQNGGNGLLYDPEHPMPLDFSRAEHLGAAARSSCENGRVNWLSSLPKIKCFLEDRLQDYHPHGHPVIRLKGRSIARARKVYRLLKRIARKGW